MTDTRRCSGCGAALPPDAPLGLCPKCVLKQGLDSLGATAPSQAATGFSPPLIEDLAPHFPHLEILEFLGQGGMGAVYKARQPELDRLVAIKILAPDTGSDPAFAERFKREARSLARLNHPHIVAVYDFGQAAGLYYFVMEYVDGVNLRQMERTERLAPREALGIVVQICEALQYAHEEGIVHRDIKPENLLIDKKGRLKIADFGLAKLMARTPKDFTLTQAEQVMGTPHYMAPEQMEHPAEVDQRADIYSLGVVFYEMLTGELPLGRFQPPSQKVLMDVRLDEVVLKTLEREPERRYQQASQVKTDVQVISGGPGVADEARGPRAERRWERWWFGQSELKRRCIRAALLLVTVAGMVGLLGYHRDQENLGEGKVHTLTQIGLWGPWYVDERTDGIGGRHEVSPYAGSCIFGGVGALSAWAGVMIFRSEKRRRTRQARGRPHPQANQARTDVESITVSSRPAAPAGEARPPAPAAGPAGAPPQTPAPVRPRFSRAAIVGAVLAPLAIALAGPLAALSVVQTMPSPAGGQESDSSGTIALLTVVALSVLGLVAPLATTIVGIVAISQIRRSCGRLYGMGLALFDALVFPLIALDCHLVMGCALVTGHQWGSLKLGIALGMLIAIAVDVLIVWLVNRAVRRPVPGAAAAS